MRRRAADTAATIAPGVAPNRSSECPQWQALALTPVGPNEAKNEKTPAKPGFDASGQYWIRTGDLCRVKAAL